jgi:hypothetical protein
MRALAAATEGRTDVFPRGIRLAAEVRFSKFVPARNYCEKTVPQRLKPHAVQYVYGTAEAVPFVQAFSRSLKISRLAQL